MKFFDIATPAKTRCIKVSRVNGGLVCTGFDVEHETIAIKNKTQRTLSNGTIIPSESKMMRLAYKSGV